MAATDDDATDFTYYETTAVDPGVGFTLLVMAVCVLIVLSLPLWLRIGARFSGAKVEPEDENNGTVENTHNNPEAAAEMEALMDYDEEQDAAQEQPNDTEESD